MPTLKSTLKSLVARALRPAVHRIDEGVHAIDHKLDALLARTARLEEAYEKLSGSTLEREKHKEELAYWRWLITTDKGRASLYAPFETAFGAWQRDRLLELGEFLGLGHPDNGNREALGQAIDDWCATRSAIEIGAGPYPALAAAPRWKRAVAVDPIARGYAEENLLPQAASHITYLEASGERIPLPSASADLVIIENALDHVSDPAAVLAEIRRLLSPSGLLWVLVDLSNYSDHMHPHPFNEDRLRQLLKAAGFEPLRDRISTHKSHPQAYGEYRGLLRKLPAATPAIPAAHALHRA
jgi:SAM-dependent methyltransferase